MARLLLISFGDNDTAESFVRTLDQLQQGEYPGLTDQAITELGMILGSGSVMEAMIARPTMPCRCAGSSSRKTVKEYKKTKRFGWWVHATCNRPSREMIRHFIDHRIMDYRNLLVEILNPDLQAQIENEQPTSWPPSMTEADKRQYIESAFGIRIRELWEQQEAAKKAAVTSTGDPVAEDPQPAVAPAPFVTEMQYIKETYGVQGQS
jgi:hypothetical protein